MDRLLMLHLQAQGCAAEAWLNGVPLARVTAERPRWSLPLHEYIQTGQNRLVLVVAEAEAALLRRPAAHTSVLRQPASASLGLFLHGSDGGDRRALAQINWAPALNSRCALPLTLTEDVSLPVSFPRWRWLDAPVVELSVALQAKLQEWLQNIALDMEFGQFDSYLGATALRLEELCLAYQRKRGEETTRQMAYLQQLYAAERLKMEEVKTENLYLRPVAAGRLFECLDSAGQPALRSRADDAGQVALFPFRVASVEGQFYVLR